MLAPECLSRRACRLARHLHFVCNHPDAIALPIYIFCLPPAITATGATVRKDVRLRPEELKVFMFLSAIITIGSAILAMMGTHLLPLLQARGLDLSLAVGIGMIVGPSQVGARTRGDACWQSVSPDLDNGRLGRPRRSFGRDAPCRIFAGDGGHRAIRRRKRHRFGGAWHRSNGAFRPRAISGFDGSLGSPASDRHGNFAICRGIGVPIWRRFRNACCLGCPCLHKRRAYRRALAASFEGQRMIAQWCSLQSQAQKQTVG